MTNRGQLACALLLAGAACGLPSTPGTPPAGPASGALVPVATPPGDPVSATRSARIGDAGGELSSSDGALVVSVPAGAMIASTELTLTPIANTARGAVGPAFRLGPEGTTFAKPVALTFQVPEKLPTGTSLAAIGVEYQDTRGFWHRVEPVTRDAGASTVTVSSTHFSDWAATWQTGTPAAEGPITLVQTVGIPFTASGRATVYLQYDTPTDTLYALTGTLTVPATFTVGESTCVPDQVTKTLPVNMSEVHKGEPPVFRWGLGVTWTLTCTAPGGAVTTELLPAQFDTMYINLTRCGGAYAAGQVVTADRLAGAYTKDCGLEGTVSASWDLRACVPGLECPLGADCRLGVTTCDGLVQSCVDAGPAPAGTPCSEGVCTPAQACVACTEGGPCGPANPCNATGTLNCAAGAICTDGPPLPAGSSCGPNLYCDPSNACTCEAQRPCVPADPCHVGVTDCPGGVLTCRDTGQLAAPGTVCGAPADGKVCTPLGACVACTDGAACPPANACDATGRISCALGAICVDGPPLGAGAACGTNLYCDASNACTCQALLACEPLATDPCHEAQTQCPAGVQTCTATATPIPGAVCDTVLGLHCDPDGACACHAGVACASLADDPCHLAETQCPGGVQTCTATATPNPGASCDPALELFCDVAGNCLCQARQACELAEPPDACHAGRTECSTGVALCTSEPTPGVSCDAGQKLFCDTSGACTCQAEQACELPEPPDACHTGRTECSTGVAACASVPTPGVSCDVARSLFCDTEGTCACVGGEGCALAAPDACHVGKTSCTTGTSVCAPEVVAGASCGVDLYCDPAGGCTCQAGTACGPLASDPCHEAATQCPGGVQTCAATTTPRPGAACDPALQRFCDPSGACACQAGTTCGPLASDPCHKAETQCPGGVQTCTATTAPNPGASCDPAQQLFCDPAGACACKAGLSCALSSPDGCHVGKTECSTGVALCVAEQLPAGTSCDASQQLHCDPSGGCSCQAGQPCALATPDACHAGRTDCSTGVVACVAIPTPGVSCDAGQSLFCDTTGACACVAGQTCSLATPDACHVGKTSCTTGAQQCLAEALPPGTSCDAGQQLFCDPSGACACQAGAACGPLASDPCHLAATACPGGLQTCAATATPNPGAVCDPALELFCDASGACACQAGASCPPLATDPCHLAATQCPGGVQTCAATATPNPGASCDPAQQLFCDTAGACACQADQPCALATPDACHVGKTECSTGVALCVAEPVPGASCDAAQDLFCDPAGACTCQADQPCELATPDACHVGKTDCSTGVPACVAVPAPGASCDPGQSLFCDTAGACTCVGGQDCTLESPDACHVGKTSCATGTSACTPEVVAGASCGADLFCDPAGSCSCQAGGACSLAEDRCHAAELQCPGGVQTCVATTVTAGASCDPALSLFCAPDGGCTCQADVACAPLATDPCHEAATTCPDGVSTCSATATPLPDDTACVINDVAGVCRSGVCEVAVASTP